MVASEACCTVLLMLSELFPGVLAVDIDYRFISSVQIIPASPVKMRGIISDIIVEIRKIRGNPKLGNSSLFCNF